MPFLCTKGEIFSRVADLIQKKIHEMFKEKERRTCKRDEGKIKNKF